MESYEGFRDRSLEFASFCRILRRFGAFCVVLVQIFRQSNLNSKLNFDQIPVVISKLYIYDIFIYIYLYIKACKKSFLLSQGDVWIEKTGSFDVIMGSYDGAEVCELVGLYLPTQLNNLIPQEHLGLYRDDGLAVVALDGPGVERLRKDVSKLFKDNGLKITVEANLKSTSFLDITFDLNSSSFGPFL